MTAATLSAEEQHFVDLLAAMTLRIIRQRQAVDAARAASGMVVGDVVQVKTGWERGRTATITGVNTQTGAWTVALDSGMPGAYFSADIEKVAVSAEVPAA